MPDKIVEILIQLPIVAIFVWYVDRTNRQIQEFLKERYLEEFKLLGEIYMQLKEHDLEARKYMAIQLDREPHRKLKRQYQTKARKQAPKKVKDATVK